MSENINRLINEYGEDAAWDAARGKDHGRPGTGLIMDAMSSEEDVLSPQERAEISALRFTTNHLGDALEITKSAYVWTGGYEAGNGGPGIFDGDIVFIDGDGIYNTRGTLSYRSVSEISDWLNNGYLNPATDKEFPSVDDATEVMKKIFEQHNLMDADAYISYKGQIAAMYSTPNEDPVDLRNLFVKEPDEEFSHHVGTLVFQLDPPDPIYNDCVDNYDEVVTSKQVSYNDFNPSTEWLSLPSFIASECGYTENSLV